MASTGTAPFEVATAPKEKKLFLCVLDFEAVCEEEPKPAPVPQEIIEFPSVLLSRDPETQALVEVSRFESFVKPVIHPTLSAFCTSLTSITQDQVDSAETFPVVFEKHIQWLRNNGALSAKADLMCVTCGDWDLNKALPPQVESAGLSYKRVIGCYKRWINVKKICDDNLGGHHKGMHSLLSRFNLEFEGRPHRGIDDCINLARIVRMLDERFDVDWTVPTRKRTD